MIRTILLSSLLACTALPVLAQDFPEAKASFDQRQEDLISLSNGLGTLHRLQQVCGETSNINLFRNRMMELVPLESPMASTREAMIAAFNDAYRTASELYLSCSSDTRAAREKVAEETLIITDRLYSDFR